MDPSCLDYRLTEAEREEFETRGYLALPDALAPDQTARLAAACDRIFARNLAEGHDPTKTLTHPDFLPEDDLFLDLVDYERTLPKVWDILGWNLYLYHAHLVVTPPSGQPPDDKTFGWHQDSGRVNGDLAMEPELRPRPRLSLKVAYFLSDLSEPGRGNFWVVPGTHHRDALERPADGVGQPAGAEPVCVKPGTAVIFDRRIWHSASPNWSDLTRRVLFYGYAYRWVRPREDSTAHRLWDRCDPIRRQLLGWSSDGNGPYMPTDADVPLRTWLREHGTEG